MFPLKNLLHLIYPTFRNRAVLSLTSSFFLWYVHSRMSVGGKWGKLWEICGKHQNQIPSMMMWCKYFL